MFKVKKGDILISRMPHSCIVKFVEDINEDQVLLVDGIRDESYPIDFFYSQIMTEKYQLLCKKEDRQDI